jgi:hypothetical protein
MEKPLRKLQGGIDFSIVRREVTRVLGGAPSNADAEYTTTVVGETSRAVAIYVQLFNSVSFLGLRLRETGLLHSAKRNTYYIIVWHKTTF